MTTVQLTPKTGENFAVVDVGKFSELHQFTFEAPEKPLSGMALT